MIKCDEHNCEEEAVGYCYECEMLVKKKDALQFPEENGLYCPFCKSRLHRVVILTEEDIEERFPFWTEPFR